MTAAERQKQNRQAARAAGKCGQCLKADAVPGGFRCQACRDWQREYQRPYMKARYVPRARTERYVEWCDECLAAGFHRVGCKRAPGTSPRHRKVAV